MSPNRDPPKHTMDKPEDETDELELTDFLKHLDRESAHFVVRLERHHSGRTVTIVEPHSLTKDKAALLRLAHTLKESLGTSGDVEESRIVLHGDYRDQARNQLVRLGFPEENIETV